MPITIRRLTTADAAAYRDLRLRALREHPDAFTSSFEDEAAKPLNWSEWRLAAQEDSFFLGAWSADGLLIGMVGLLRETQRKTRHRATLIGMYVVPEANGRGVGRCLLAAGLAEARTLPGLETVRLTVTAGNARAENLYTGAGFRAFGVEQRAIRWEGRYYDKIHMTLDL